MRNSDAKVPYGDEGISGATADGLLVERDYRVYRPDKEFALGKGTQCVHPIAVERDCHLILRHGLRVASFYAQHLSFGEMSKRAAGRCLQGLPNEGLRTRNIRRL